MEIFGIKEKYKDKRRHQNVEEVSTATEYGTEGEQEKSGGNSNFNEARPKLGK